MARPNEQRLRELYNAFSHGEIDKVLGYCSDDIVFHVPGRSKLAGTYTKAEFAPRLISRVMELSAGTFRESVDDAVANDHHGVVLATATLQRGDTPHEFKTAHVWAIRDGKFIEWREYPRNLYKFDEIWG